MAAHTTIEVIFASTIKQLNMAAKRVINEIIQMTTTNSLLNEEAKGTSFKCDLEGDCVIISYTYKQFKQHEI